MAYRILFDFYKTISDKHLTKHITQVTDKVISIEYLDYT